jgi:hypothetical protein
MAKLTKWLLRLHSSTHLLQDSYVYKDSMICVGNHSHHTITKKQRSNIFSNIISFVTFLKYIVVILNLNTQRTIKMKASIIASAIALFASSAVATPLTAARSASAAASPSQLFTFSLTNDITGASAATSVPINGGAFVLRDLFPWATNLIKDGKLIATSAQNINPAVQNVFCIFSGNGKVIKINDKITFADLDGVQDKALQTDVSQFTIQCEK